MPHRSNDLTHVVAMLYRNSAYDSNPYSLEGDLLGGESAVERIQKDVSIVDVCSCTFQAASTAPSVCNTM